MGNRTRNRGSRSHHGIGGASDSSPPRSDCCADPPVANSVRPSPLGTTDGADPPGRRSVRRCGLAGFDPLVMLAAPSFFAALPSAKRSVRRKAGEHWSRQSWRRSASLKWILRKPAFLGPPEVQQERYDYRCQQDELNDPAKLTNGHVHGVCQRRRGEPVCQSEANQIREEGSKGRLFDVPRQDPLLSRRFIFVQSGTHAFIQRVCNGTANTVLPVHASYSPI